MDMFRDNSGTTWCNVPPRISTLSWWRDMVPNDTRSSVFNGNLPLVGSLYAHWSWERGKTKNESEDIYAALTSGPCLGTWDGVSEALSWTRPRGGAPQRVWVRWQPKLEALAITRVDTSVSPSLMPLCWDFCWWTGELLPWNGFWLFALLHQTWACVWLLDGSFVLFTV